LGLFHATLTVLDLTPSESVVHSLMTVRGPTDLVFKQLMKAFKNAASSIRPNSRTRCSRFERYDAAALVDVRVAERHPARLNRCGAEFSDHERYALGHQAAYKCYVAA
jgi:hypothetical protein